MRTKDGVGVTGHLGGGLVLMQDSEEMGAYRSP